MELATALVAELSAAVLPSHDRLQQLLFSRKGELLRAGLEENEAHGDKPERHAFLAAWLRGCSELESGDDVAADSAADAHVDAVSILFSKVAAQQLSDR
jgi:hypothetical protein